jgi:hypothetical protein
MPDISHVLDTLDAELDALMRRWAPVSAAQKAGVVEQVRAVAADGSLDDLDMVRVDTAPAAQLLAESMARVADAAARQVVEEAAGQGADVAAVKPRQHDLEAVARAVTWLLGLELKVSACRMALRANGPLATPVEITTAVREHLDSLSTANAETQFGGALHGAMNAARVATLRQAMAAQAPSARLTLFDRTGPEGAIYASELNDGNTCKPCREVDGKWLGNTSDMAMVERLYPSGAFGGYIHCLGRERCRGTVTGVWRPRTTEGESAPTKVPAKAKRYMRSVEGVEALAKTAQAAGKLADDAPQWRRLSGGQSGAATRMAVLDDGRRVVHKRAPDWGSDESRTQADAEHLASLTGRKLGARVAGAYRDQRDAVWVEHVPGHLVERETKAGRREYDTWLDTIEAKRMGLLDALVGNPDRNDGNMIFDDDGRATGIDHAMSYDMLGFHDRYKTFTTTPQLERGAVTPADFGPAEGPLLYFVTSGEQRNEWTADNPLTAADVAEVRRRLEELRPDYDKLGRGDWLDRSLEVLDRLAEHAGGTESLL